ncbi:hypothetical protein M2352_000203 [Azospirillum fermentarium]|nr:hypothetical protein [Azospirillum fermentarium]MCW2244612.1 hypothetical protein [Azospirillum fermentarium]
MEQALLDAVVAVILGGAMAGAVVAAAAKPAPIPVRARRRRK